MPLNPGVGLLPPGGPTRFPSNYNSPPIDGCRPVVPARLFVPASDNFNGAGYLNWQGTYQIVSNKAVTCDGNGQTLTSPGVDVSAGDRLVAVVHAGRFSHSAAYSWSMSDSAGLGTWVVDTAGPVNGTTFARSSAVTYVDCASGASGVTVTLDPWATADIGNLSMAVFVLPAGTFNPFSWRAQAVAFDYVDPGKLATPALAGATTGITFAVGFSEANFNGSQSTTWDPPEGNFSPLAQHVSGYYNVRVQVSYSGDVTGSTVLSYTPEAPGMELNLEGVLFELAPGAIAKALSGAITSSGSLLRRPNKSLTGTVSSSGALVRQVGRLFAAAVTSSGVLTKRPGRAFTAAITSSATLTNRPGKALTGTVTGTGVITLRSVGKALAATITSGGALTKRPGHLLSGAIASSGALSSTRTVLVALSGAISSAGSLVKKPIRSFTAACTSAGVLLKRPGKSLTGVITSAGALTSSKTILKALAGAISSAGNLTNRPGKALVGVLTSAGVLLKRPGKVATGAVASQGALSKRPGRILTGSVNLSGVLLKRPGKVLGGAAAASGVLVKMARKLLVSALSFVGDLVPLPLIPETITGAITRAIRDYGHTATARLRTSAAVYSRKHSATVKETK